MISCNPTPESGNACRGFIIGSFLAGIVYGSLTWVVTLVWNAITRQHVTYWQMLAITLGVGAVSGGLIALWGMRKETKG
jgi:hypothetical protein